MSATPSIPRSTIRKPPSKVGAFGYVLTLLSFVQAVSVWASAWAHVYTGLDSPAILATRLADTVRRVHAGDSNAERDLGSFYCIGHYTGVAMNLKRSAWWYRSAAQHGNIEAQQTIAEYYEFGYGVRPNHAKALAWIHKAMAKDPQSALGIAEHYESGERMSLREGCSHLERVPGDLVKAIEWYRIAADAGDARCQTLLGELYERETAVQDLAEALRWYRMAAQTDSRAMGDLAHAYETGMGVPQDYGEAAKWYSKAVERSGYPTDQYKLGLLYEKGLRIAQSREKALEFYAFAAANGISDAQRRLFTLYETDLGLPSDPGKVIVWYEAAAQAGDRRAQVGLGLHYQYGTGVAQNGDVACALYLLAQHSQGGHGDLQPEVIQD